MGNRDVFRGAHLQKYAIPSERTLYFDTSALQSAGHRLLTLDVAKIGYTSVLAIVELVSGITISENNYRKRRLVLLHALGLPIDWQFPDVKTACSFELLRDKYDIYEKRAECLDKVLACIIASNTLTEFRSAEKARDLTHSIGYFEDFDAQIDRTWRRGEGHRDFVKGLFEDSSKPRLLDLLGLPSDTGFRDFGEIFRRHPLNVGFSRYIVFCKLNETLQIEDTAEQDRVFRSYNGSIDYYLRGFGLWSADREYRGDRSRRNDGQDLAHLLHIVPDGTLVTEDKKMRKLAQEIGLPVMNLSGT